MRLEERDRREAGGKAGRKEGRKERCARVRAHEEDRERGGGENRVCEKEGEGSQGVGGTDARVESRRVFSRL